MKNKFLYIILFSFSFSQFELDPRMLGMSGAYTSVASGYQAMGVNPANLVSNQSLSLNLFSANTFMVNDFLSVDLYNQLNGADFDNTSSTSYYSKNDILGLYAMHLLIVKSMISHKKASIPVGDFS